MKYLSDSEIRLFNYVFEQLNNQIQLQLKYIQKGGADFSNDSPAEMLAKVKYL